MPSWWLPNKYPYSEDPRYWASVIGSRLGIIEKMKTHPNRDYRSLILETVAMTLEGKPYQLAGAWEPALLLQHRHARSIGHFVSSDSSYLEREEQILDELEDMLFEDRLELHAHSFMKKEIALVAFSESLRKSLDGYTPVLIDFNQDLDSIKETLEELWEGLSSAQKKKLGRVSFARWHKFCVIPYFDVSVFAPLFGFAPLDTEIADFFWHLEDIDQPERLRKTTKKLITQVFTEKTLRRLL